MTITTDSETTTLRIVTIKVCKVNTTVKLHVKHGQKMTPKVTFLTQLRKSTNTSHKNEQNHIMANSVSSVSFCNIFTDSNRS